MLRWLLGFKNKYQWFLGMLSPWQRYDPPTKKLVEQNFECLDMHRLRLRMHHNLLQSLDFAVTTTLVFKMALIMSVMKTKTLLN
jgi:hypothetical protein